MFSNFNYDLKRIINNSKKEMEKLGHLYIGTEHFLLAILKSNDELCDLLNSYNVTYEIFKDKIIENIGVGTKKESLYVFTPLFKKILEESMIVTNELNMKEVETTTVFKVMLDEAEGVAYRLLCELNVNVDELYDSINNISINKTNNIFGNIGVDLTEKAKEGLIQLISNAVIIGLMSFLLAYFTSLTILYSVLISIGSMYILNIIFGAIVVAQPNLKDGNGEFVI